jgi:hypothetical protein
VIAIADSEEHHRGIVRHSVTRRKRRRTRQGAQRLGHAFTLRPVDGVSGDMPATEHQVGFVQLRQRLSLGTDWFYHRARWIVDQHEDVWQFQFGAASHLDARGEARDHRAFGRADRACGLAAEVVLLEIEFQHQPAADSMADGSLYVDGAFALAE